MTKLAQPTNQEHPAPKPVMRTWYMELVLGSVALAVTYLSATLALDTGSLVGYSIAMLFLVLAVRHFYNAGRAYARGRANGKDQR